MILVKRDQGISQWLNAVPDHKFILLHYKALFSNNIKITQLPRIHLFKSSNITQSTVLIAKGQKMRKLARTNLYHALANASASSVGFS